MTDTDLIAEARKGWPERMFEGSLINELADALESRVAEVSALREVIQKVNELDDRNNIMLASHVRAILASVPAVASPETKGTK